MWDKSGTSDGALGLRESDDFFPGICPFKYLQEPHADVCCSAHRPEFCLYSHFSQMPCHLWRLVVGIHGSESPLEVVSGWGTPGFQAPASPGWHMPLWDGWSEEGPSLKVQDLVGVPVSLSAMVLSTFSWIGSVQAASPSLSHLPGPLSGAPH